MKNYIVLFLLVFASCNSNTEKPSKNVGAKNTSDTSSNTSAGADLPSEIIIKEPAVDKGLIISRLNGDLNKDGVNDLVTVTKDTMGVKTSYNLRIYLSQANKKLKLVLHSDSAIVARDKDVKNNLTNDAIFSEIEIKRGTLCIKHELIRGNFWHQFRFQNNKFELIGYHSVGVSGGSIEETDFNLSTGRKMIKIGKIGDDLYNDQSETTERIKYLPNLALFRPYDFIY